MTADADFLSLLRDEGLEKLMLLACPDGIVVTDTHDRILVFGGAAEQLFNRSAVDVARREAAMLFADEEKYRLFLAELTERGRVANYELPAINRSGVLFPAAVSAAVLKDRYGEELATVMYIRDHSKVRTIEESLRQNNTQLNKLGYMARHDQLTGLFNRGNAILRAEESLAALRDRAALGIVILDVDDFKRVNDSYGHLVGDEVLSWLAKMLSCATREGDIVGRFGGEEFVIFLPGADLRRTVTLAERTRQTIEEAVTILDGGTQLNLTISCGVSSIPECTDTLSDAIRVADNRLLVAKRTGRNRVISTDLGERTAA